MNVCHIYTYSNISFSFEKEAPIHVSNIAIVDPKTGKPTRVGYREVDGKKVRFAIKSGESLDK